MSQATTPILRRAVPPDAAAIARVQIDSWRAAYAGLMPDHVLASLSIEQRTERWASILGAPDSPLHMTFVAEGEGEILGFASIGTARDADAHAETTAELHALYVCPERVGSGLGHSLFARAGAELAGRGLRAMTLWVLVGNERAIRFYEAEGMVADGATKTEIEHGAELPHVRYALSLVAPAS